MTVTFGGSTVSVIRDTEISVDAPFKETTLLSGKTYIQASPEQKFALLGKLGSPGTLVIDSDSYTSCYIVPPIRYKEVIKGSGKYTYTISFVRHTA